MPTNIDFTDRQQIASWLKDKPREVAVIYAARTALRLAPLLAEALAPRRSTALRAAQLLAGLLGPRGGTERAGREIALPVFRAMAAPWVAGQYPTHGTAAARTAADAAYAAYSYAAAADAAAYATARNASYAAAAAARNAAAAADAADADTANAYAAAAAAVATATGAAYTAAADAEIIDEGAGASVLAARPLWLMEAPVWAREAWQRLEQALLQENQDWRVWTNWYRARLEGRPANEALEVARMLIADQTWKRGPRAVNAEIARLIEQHEGRKGEDAGTRSLSSIREPHRSGSAPGWDFFLSFSREDEPFARWIEKLLRAYKLSVFAEFTEMPAGSNFIREIQRGLERSSRVIALLSPDYIESDHCMAEWSAAYNTYPGGTARKLMPFLVRPAQLPPLVAEMVYKPLVGLSPADAATAILQATGYEGSVGDIPPGWPATGIEEMRAATGGIYDVAPGVESLLERQPPGISDTDEAGFTPEQLFADIAREVEEFATHVIKGRRNFRCSDQLKERVARLRQSIATTFANCDILAINKRLVWVLKTLADDQADGIIPRSDPLEHYASDLYGYYNRLEVIFPKLKPFRQMDARHRFALPSEEEERAIREVYRMFGDPAFAKGALSKDLSEEMKQAGKSIEEAKEDAAKKKADKPSDATIESHVDAAARSLAVWGWLSNPRDNFIKSGKGGEASEKPVKDYEQLYDRMSPQMTKYIGYLLKWFF